MNKSIDEIKIPTVLGIFLLLMGISSGVLLTYNGKLQTIGASSSYVPKNVRISNITGNSFTVSWTTDNQTQSRIVWGKDKNLNNSLVVSDQKNFTHWVTITNLSEHTGYSFKIVSEKVFDNEGIPWSVKTGSDLNKNPTNFINGKVVSANGLEVKDALVYLTVSGSNLLSVKTNDNGVFKIDTSEARRSDLNSWQEVDNNSMLEIFVNAGPFGNSSVLSYLAVSKPLPVIVLGESYTYKNLPSDKIIDTPTSEIKLPDNTVVQPGDGFSP